MTVMENRIVPVLEDGTIPMMEHWQIMEVAIQADQAGEYATLGCYGMQHAGG